MTNQQKETRPAAAATAQDARKEVLDITSDSTPAGASRQALAVEEFLKTSLFGFVSDLEEQINEASRLRDAFGIISDVFDLDTKDDYTRQCGSVAKIAWGHASKLAEDMQKTMADIQAYDKRRRELCGEDMA